MSKKTFRGRVVLEGKVTGTATVSRQAFNTSGSYLENMLAGRTDAAPCTDFSNKELYGKDLSGAILCTTTTVGSTMGGMCLMAAAGVLMSDIWKDRRIVTIDMLGDEFLETVQMGDPIAIHSDGTVEIG